MNDARWLCVLALSALCGCATSAGVTSSASEAGMPCAQAQRVANGALLRLGYHPETVTAPQPGVPGTVVGHRNTGWAMADPRPGTEYTATVAITCSNQGAKFEAHTDEPLPGSLTFKTRFAE